MRQSPCEGTAYKNLQQLWSCCSTLYNFGCRLVALAAPLWEVGRIPPQWRRHLTRRGRSARLMTAFSSLPVTTMTGECLEDAMRRIILAILRHFGEIDTNYRAHGVQRA